MISAWNWKMDAMDCWGRMFLDTSRKQAHYLDTYNYGETYTHRTIDLYVKLVA